jgi:hypothetical protein
MRTYFVFVGVFVGILAVSGAIYNFQSEKDYKENMGLEPAVLAGEVRDVPYQSIEDTREIRRQIRARKPHHRSPAQEENLRKKRVDFMRGIGVRGYSEDVAPMIHAEDEI